SIASAGLLVWVIATDGAGRPGSMVGGLACLGVLAGEPVARPLGRPRARGPPGWGGGGLACGGGGAAEPVARRLAGGGAGGRPLPPLPLATAHLALVAVAARGVGRRETGAGGLPRGVAARRLGRRETVAEALPLAVAALAVGLAVAVVALRRIAAAHTPN